MQLTLVYPATEGGQPSVEVPIDLNTTDWVQFMPATDAQTQDGNNVAKFILTPTFTVNGWYQLKVTARDRSGNNFAAKPYLITFEIDNKPSVTNVLNYPNPFTSQTRFVFTLRGSEVPTTFKIQILTASGRVVREISHAELGPMHIGNNISEFAWDGTDQFGSPLANGLYLYRVVVKMNGVEMERRASGADDWISEHGWGKMYLLR